MPSLRCALSTCAGGALILGSALLEALRSERASAAALVAS
jgi:hypothetical protein